MKIISVVGTKDTGKTTLVVKIVKELVNRGFKVGTIKHMHKSFDVEGRDTWKHKEAGAELVIGSADETFFLINQKLDIENLLTRSECLLNLDFMVIEGLKYSNYAKISVSSFEDEFTISKVNAKEIDDKGLKELVDLIEKRSYGILPYMDCKDCGYDSCKDMAIAAAKGETIEQVCVMKKMKELELKVDGKPIPMNPFVQTFVQNTTLGMISSLRGDALKDFESKKIELIINGGNIEKTY
ncbi:molybdopterin-guanine dinucleotide biosynthesis protein B [Methanobacterium oryzae]|uniref:molybdopterin-guanine dinucleotide biosynthesis protein B n=1 Tax=Methanobacterium oryzae TaxID=69540 RepID=UPI003D255D6B